MEEETIKSRIKLALKLTGKTQTELGNLLGLERGTVSEMLNGSGDPPIKYVEMAAKLTGYRYEWILTGSKPMFTSPDLIGVKLSVKENIHDRVKEEQPPYLTGKSVRVLTVTVDKAGRELIVHVPVRAQAGYSKGYGDPKFIEKLPAYSLPGFNDHGTFRMFDVAGDSMLQLGGGGLKDGDKVIGQYVEDLFTLKENMVYVIVYSEGVVIKRIINRLSTPDKALILKSDNKSGSYPNFIVHAQDILEAWEYKAHISRQLNFATDLWELINEMQANQAILSERVDKMDSATRALLNQKK